MSRPRRATAAAPSPPASGQASAGTPFDPTALAPPGHTAAHRDKAMPAPQTPLPEREIERLKAQASTSTRVAAVPGQQDPAAKARHR